VERGNAYTIFFAALICVIASLSLTFVTQKLEPYKTANELAYQRKNILLAFGMDGTELAKMKNDAINDLYTQRIEELVLHKDGYLVPDRTVASLKPDENASDKDLLALYQFKADGAIAGYALPIVGKGLWSTLYGYLALEKDLNTVLGITFYKHGETPGLGGEISEAWFQENFRGKKILDADGKLRSISVVKGLVHERIHDEGQKRHFVDGISGATITSKGVTAMLAETLEIYQAYFSKLRGGM